MSLNITVNGKFIKHSASQPIIGDNEYVKKQQQYERRKWRLREVRSQSNELARKIRNDVSEEKKRQLENLEGVKAQELQCWREYVLAQKSHDYSNALGAVGSAHCAAQLEKEEMAAKQAAAENASSSRPMYKSPARSCFKYPSRRSRQTPLHNKKEELSQDPKMQSYHVCFEEKYTQYSISSSSLSDIDSDKNSDIDTCELLDSSSSLSSTESCKLKKAKTTNEEATVCQNAMGVTQVDINQSPKKTLTNTGTQTLASVNVLFTKDKANVIVASGSSSSSGEIIESQTLPHYTQISELIARQRSDELSSQKEYFYSESKSPRSSSPRKSRSPTRRSHSSAATISTGAPSGLSKTSGTTKTSSSSPSNKKSPLKLKPKDKTPLPTTKSVQELRPQASKTSTGTFTMPDDTDSRTRQSSVVQYYDYNNKYSKDYIPSSSTATQHQPLQSDEPNAMDRATIEKNLQKEREKEIDKLRQKSEERGKLALEREQVRRDCNELTQKLEALTKQRQSLLPSDAHLHGHEFYSIKAARKESKMNNALEELLSRPAVITCPEVKYDKPSISLRVGSSIPLNMNSLGLNLGASQLNRAGTSGSSASSGSGSILLGYIDDQRTQIRNEIGQYGTTSKTNEEKRDKLTRLLERIESLRESLLSELKEKDQEIEPQKMADSKNEATTKSTNKVSTARKQPKTATTITATMETRERDLQEREIRLEQKLSEFNEIQNALDKGTGGVTAKEVVIKTKSGKEKIIEHTNPEKPLEIVIKVKGEKKVSKRKAKIITPQPSKTSKLPIQQDSATKKPTNTPPIDNTQSNLLPRRDSYDSNSTAYRPMPPALTKSTEQFVDRVQQLDNTDSQTQPLSSIDSSLPTQTASTPIDDRAVIRMHTKKKTHHLNPLIAQYIQRLLGMSRKSILALEVSSSDIETPGSSVINITGNIGGTTSSVSGENALLSEDHVQRVERFVNDNRSFINELEESIRTHSNASLETSMRRFEDIWKQRLKQKTPKDTKDTNKLQSRPVVTKMHKSQNTKSKTKIEKDDGKPKVVEKVIQKSVTAQKRIQVTKPTTTTTKESTNESPKNQQTTHIQLEHYAQLTKNCSKRIAELTELITKVRKEKQRLLEVTLTSVSDNERLSTEYGELPENPKQPSKQRKEKHQDTGSDSSASDSQLITTDSRPRTDVSAPVTQEAGQMQPLEKNKKTGRSRDSGISMPSRPVTALGPDQEIEQLSHASSVSTVPNTITQNNDNQRKTKHPPATIHRFSPGLPENDAVHELSTIAEVDTPATSRLNTSQLPTDAQLAAARGNRQAAPVRFPTFEEYVKELNLDLTEMDQEQSLRMEQEYNELIDAIKEGRGGKALSYEEFPTLTAYLQDITISEDSCRSPETIDDLFACLKLSQMTAKPFPTHQEYLQQLTQTSPENEFLDTESLDNLSELPSILSDSESDTLNIEDELKRRNILKKSFRSSSTKQEFFSSSTDKRLQSKTTSHSTNIESGIEPLGNTTTSTDSASEKFQKELLSLGLQWPKAMRNKEKETAALSSTSPEVSSKTKHEKFKGTLKISEKKDKSTADYLSDSESSERPLNLRDFLTRQLLKHAAATSSCESSLSGDSLRSQFFLAVLDSMTPSGSPREHTAAGHSGGHERKKTSTPVPLQSSSIHVNNHHDPNVNPSHSELFSGESRLSSVHGSMHKKQTTKSKSQPEEVEIEEEEEEEEDAK